MPDDELDDPFSANPTLKMQIQRFLRDLERKGLVRRNGRFRNGQPVYIRSSRTSISSCRSAKISADKYPIFTPKLLRDLVERTRKIGYALIEALVVPGSYGIGVAVPDNRGQPLAALSIAAIASGQLRQVASSPSLHLTRLNVMFCHGPCNRGRRSRPAGRQSWRPWTRERPAGQQPAPRFVTLDDKPL